MLINATVSSGSTIATTSETSVTYDGVTFTFDRAMPVGYDTLGEPFVVSDQAFAITQVSPVSVQTNAAWANGLMQDPVINRDGTGEQGFDEFLDANVNPSDGTAITYTAALNLDPDAHANGNISVALGEETSLVKTARLSSVTTNTSWQTIEKYVVLSIVASTPSTGWFRAGASDPSKAGLVVPTINTSAFRSLTLPGSFPTTVAGAIGYIPSSLGLFGIVGQQLRRLRLDVAANGASQNYAANVTPYHALALIAGHSSGATTEQKETVAKRAIRYALDIKGLIDAGSSFDQVGAGQGFAIGLWAYAGAIFANNSGLLANARSLGTQTDGAFWVDASNVGRTPGSRSGSPNYPGQVFYDAQIGEPFIVPDTYGSQYEAFYGIIASVAVVTECLAVAILQAGSGAVSGVAALLNGATQLNTTNNKSSNLALMNKVRQWNIATDNQGPYITTWWKDLFDDVYTAAGISLYTDAPQQPPLGDSGSWSDPYFSVGASAGEIDLDATGAGSTLLDFATETITATHFYHAIDNGVPPVQWIKTASVTLTANAYTKTGLLNGADYWAAWSRESASGEGIKSQSHPYQGALDGSVGPGKVTTTGTPGAAIPDWTGGTAPAIHQKIAPQWSWDTWGVAPSTLAVNDVELAAGLGDIASGYPAPTFTYQWKRGITNLVTTQTYDRVAADASAVLTCEVTATNASGSDTVTTASVTCPALTTLPSTTLIDTDFRGAFAVDYATELAAVSVNDATAEHEAVRSDFDTQNFGMLRAEKTAGTPSITLPLQNPAVAGTTYDITAELLALLQFSFHSFLGNIYIEIRNATGTVFFTQSLSPAVSDVEEFLSITDTFTVAGGTTDLDLFVRIGNTTGSGGGDGGDAALSQLTIAEV